MSVSWEDIGRKWVTEVTNDVAVNYKIISHGNTIYISRPNSSRGRVGIVFHHGGITIITTSAEGKMDIASADAMDVMNPETDVEESFKSILAEKLKVL